MLSTRYIELPTCPFTYLLCFFQFVLLCSAPTSAPIVISLWILPILVQRGVCCLPSSFHDLLRIKKQGYKLHLSKNCSIACDTHLTLPSASVAVKKDTCYYYNPLSESPSVTEDRTSKGFSNMSAPDPFQAIVDALKRIVTPAPFTPPVMPVTNAATSSSTVLTSPMAKPAPFSGSVKECDGFLLQCSLVLEMQPNLYTTDRAKIALFISLLTGQALQWAKTIWSQAGTVTLSFDNFIAHFQEVFGRPAGDTAVSEQLYHLRQGCLSINDYALKFRTLAAASGWNERSLLTTYRQGLEPRVRLQLAAYDDSYVWNILYSCPSYVLLVCNPVLKNINFHHLLHSFAGQIPSALQNQVTNLCWWIVLDSHHRNGRDG